jgi:acetyltransferase-like isoleucine patch superfamily enzyme
MKSLIVELARTLYMYYVDFGNYVVAYIPGIPVRRFLFKHVYRIKMGEGVVIHMGVKFKRPWSIEIGDYSVVNPRALLDGRMGLKIGNNVDIGEDVSIYCGGHDIQDPEYGAYMTPIEIGDRACIYARAMIIRGGKVGEGAVVAAGSIVTRNVEPYTIVAGNPAKKLGDRNRNLTYSLNPKHIRKTWQDIAKTYDEEQPK